MMTMKINDYYDADDCGGVLLYDVDGHGQL